MAGAILGVDAGTSGIAVVSVAVLPAPARHPVTAANGIALTAALLPEAALGIHMFLGGAHLSGAEEEGDATTGAVDLHLLARPHLDLSHGAQVPTEAGHLAIGRPVLHVVAV